MKIVHLLNDIYVKFDQLTDKEVNPKVSYREISLVSVIT